jgi:photosystem II stability/assembly factor-like uncharacterized protein
MISLKGTLCVLCVCLAGGLLISLVEAHEHIDVEYAEQMPLATESMLLDITRIGGNFVAVGERGHVVLSMDGKTWSQAEHVPTRSTLTTVFSKGKRLWAGGHDAVIITSGDGGNTWTQLFFDPDRQQAVMDINFSDEKNGVAIGSYGLYLKTSDGGQNWEEATVDPELDYHLNSLLNFGDGKRVIAGEAGYSYRSYDDGETWEAMDMPYQGSMWGALKTSDNCALFFGLRGHVMESCDMGLNWRELDTGSEASISGAAEHNGFILLASNSGILLTRDDGDSFSIRQHSSGVDFSAVISLEDGSFLLVGEDGAHSYPESRNDGDANVDD